MKGGVSMALTDIKHIPGNQALLPLSKCDDKEAFKDNIEHLEALEYISRLRLARVYLLGGKPIKQSPMPRHRHVQIKQSEDLLGPSALLFPEVSAGEVTLDEI